MRVDRMEQMCYNMGMGKPYTLLETKADGTEVRLYENGDKRNQNGQLLEHNGKGNEIITPENSRYYRELRKQKILTAIENGLMRVTDAPNPSEAIAHIVTKRAEVAMLDNGRAGNDAAKIVLAAMDALPDRQTENVQVQRHEYSIDEDTMRVVEELVRMRRDGTNTAEKI